MRYLFLAILVFFASSGYGSAKRALKLLEKGEYQKLIEYLDKSIEKDSLNPGAYYVYSLLFNTPAFSANNLDSAYHYILISMEMMDRIDEKGLKKLVKAEINDSSISVQKQKLDLQGYERAGKLHTVDDYDAYIANFSTSEYRTKAIEDRNELAYEIAERENTYQSFLRFMQTYPDSEQYKVAKNNYDKLLFEDQIRDGTLKKYSDFIVKYPDSPFLPMAIENIYNLSTCGNTDGSLVQFIKKFPESEWVSDAIDRLYHNHIAEQKNDFTYEFSVLPISDSIKNVEKFNHAVLIPVLENDKYGFITTIGETAIPYRYDSLDPAYLCGNITNDFLKVRNDGMTILVSRTGAVISTDEFDEVEDIGYGLLKVKKQNHYGIIFKTGKPLISPEFDDIERLDDRFIKAKQSGSWRLYSINGLLIDEDQFQEIYREGRFIALSMDNKWAVTTGERITDSFIDGKVELNFKYDDYELVEPSQILCMVGERETVLDQELKEKIPLDYQNIYTLQEGWLVRKDSLYHIFDDAFVRISGSGFGNVKYRGKWIAGRTGNKWILYYNYAPFPDIFAYDSLNILSDKFVLGYEEQMPFLIFTNLKRQELSGFESILILKVNAENEINQKTGEMLSISFGRTKKTIFSEEGKEVISGDYEEVQEIGPEYLTILRRGKTGLIDTAGNVLLKPVYDAIANYDEGFVSILNQRKFGLYNMHLNLLVSPRYDRLVSAYNQNYLMVHEKEGYGLIDHAQKSVTDKDFDEIVYWNDTSMLARREGLWNIFDLKNQVYILENIVYFEYLKNGDEKIIIYNKDNHFGVAASHSGILINHTFNDIVNLGNADDPVYFAEKYIPEAEFYIVIYYDELGRILRKQVFDEKEYDKIYCN